MQAKPKYREALRKHVGRALDEHAAVVVFTELVANVVRHAPGSIKISLECNGEEVLLSVTDNGPGFHFSDPAPPDMLSETGRGLFIVSRYVRKMQVVKRGGAGTNVIASLR